MAEEKHLICSSEVLQEGGSGFRFEVLRHGETLPAFAVRFHGRVHAYLNRCAHVPVELDWLPGAFFDDSKLYLICATHGALYAPDTGRCAGGRCNGQSLEKLPVVEMEGAVFYVASSRAHPL